MNTLMIFAEVQGQGFWREYISLLHDLPHYAFEFTNEAITAAVVLPLWRRAKRRAIREHDARFHPYAHSHAKSDDCVVD